MAEKKTKKAEVEATEAVETVETVETKKTAKKAVEESIDELETVEETPQVVEAVEAPVKTEAPVNPEKFLKDFNWHNYEEGIDQVDDKQLKEFEKLVSENFVDTLNDEVVIGEVVHISDRDAIIDINAKSEGVISLNEFRYNPNLKVGDKVEVLIDVREDATGQLVLSHRKARVIKAWDRVNNAHDTGEIVNGFVKCRTKGGMIVDVFGI
jgi:small subunit ribosomal protein S1